MSSSPTHPWDKDYDNAGFSSIYEPLWSLFQKFLDSVPVKTVLDYGCGDGIYSYLLSETGFKVTGIDISEKAIEKANARKCTNCIFIRHSSIPNYLPNGYFDVVVMLNSLHCMSNIQRIEILRQIKRVLKQNGYLFASVLSLNDESYPRHEWKEIELNTFIDETGKVFHFYSSGELKEELNGFQIIETKVLQNIHPSCGRRSALFVVTAQKAELRMEYTHDDTG